MSSYTPIIGLEVHIELATKSKMFCGCKNDPFHASKPNTYTCPVCLGLPGALPVPNRKAVEWTILLGLTLGCEIPELSKFDRKHYFYPDLPKGYQISQYDQPLAINGKVELDSGNQRIKPHQIRIRRVHLEEDTAKLIHVTIDGKKVSLIDFNRSGVPLVEIVTEPDIRSSEEAKAFLKKIHQIVQYLGISDADMEKGSMRLEPNISVRRLKVSTGSIRTRKSRSDPDELPGYKVEVKNINSFNFAKRAIEYEVKRQVELLDRGETPIQENRGWNEAKGETVPQRTKEEAEDYRYFPDPDIPPMRFEQVTINNLQLTIPELPDAKKERFMKDYALGDYDASFLVETRQLADYFEECVRVARALKAVDLTPKKIANWLINKQVDLDTVLPAQLIGRIIKATQVVAVSDEKLEKVITQIISENQKAVEDYKKGREQALMFLVGQVKRIHKQVDSLKIIGIIKKSI